MTHRFPIKEIAAQAGISTATVDRVLNGRPNVSPQTHARVTAAIAELTTQEAQLSARGRRVFVDVVVEAPERFSREIRKACDAVLPGFYPIAVRSRFVMAQVMTATQIVAALDRICKRGSHGVCLKARDVPAVHEAIARLRGRGIPVVTLFTDITKGGRVAYAGLDNARAGQTAAWLMAQRVQKGFVLTARSHHTFQGEEARLIGFQAEMAHRAPHVHIVNIEDAAGLNHDTGQAVSAAISDLPHVAGVYSMGGGNRAITRVLASSGKPADVFIAHDLDADNLSLLGQEKLSYVLHHDLRRDMRNALAQILAFHRIVPPPHEGPVSDVKIVVPGNLPARFR